MRHSFFRLFVTIGTFLYLAASIAWADSQARIVRLSDVEGGVQIDQREGRGFQTAYLNSPIGQGIRVQTRDDARTEIEFEDGSTLRMAGDAQIEFTRLALRDDGAKITEIELGDGTYYGNLKHHSKDEFQLRIGGHEFTFHKNVHFRARSDHGQITLSVFKGQLDVHGNGGVIAIKKNETVMLGREDPARYTLANEIAALPMDQWDSERLQYHERYFAESSYRYDRAYSYGFSDLAYYGQYFYVPGWGYVWRPTQVGYGWDPYADGGWVWYPGYGYVWVSSYPWGWTPYRYGSWIYVNHYGWCWRPPSSYYRWSPVVVVQNPPSGYRGPQVPPHTGGSTPPVISIGTGPSPRQNWYREIPEKADSVKKTPPTGATGATTGGAATQGGKVMLPPAPPKKVIVEERESGTSGTTSTGGGATVGVKPAAPPPDVKVIVPPAPPRRVVVEESAPTKTVQPPAPPVQKRVIDDGSSSRPEKPAPPAQPPVRVIPRTPEPAPPSRPVPPPSAPPAARPAAPPPSAPPQMMRSPEQQRSPSPSQRGQEPTSQGTKK